MLLSIQYWCWNFSCVTSCVSFGTTYHSNDKSEELRYFMPVTLYDRNTKWLLLPWLLVRSPAVFHAANGDWLSQRFRVTREQYNGWYLTLVLCGTFSMCTVSLWGHSVVYTIVQQYAPLFFIDSIKYLLHVALSKGKGIL